MKEDRVAFLLLFCGMVLVKRRKASLAETMSVLPLYGRGRLLAIEMDRSGETLWQGQGLEMETGATLPGEPARQTFYPEDTQI